MPEKTKTPQEHQAVSLLKNMLQQNDADSLREDLDDMFHAYISSEFADCADDRNCKHSTYLYLKDFLNDISPLSEINRFTNSIH